MTNLNGCRRLSRRLSIIFRILFIVVSITITPGCTDRITPEPTSIIVPSPLIGNTPVITTEVTDAISPSPGLPTTTESPQPTPTQTIVPSTCPRVEQGHLFTDVITGTIAVSEKERRFYLISKRYQEPRAILTDLPCCIYPFYDPTSPYQTEYLPLIHEYKNPATDQFDNDLYLIPAREEDAIKIRWEEDKWGNNFYGWFDEQTIILVPPGSPFGSMVLLNLFTGEQKNVSTSYEDLFDHYDYFQWNPSGAVYDPSLTRAVFLTRGPYSMVLVDLETNEELWQYHDPLSVNHEPVWLPNGEGFILTKPVHGNPEYSWISSVSREGAERLIQENPIYTGDPYGDFTMSPNGEYISFIWEDESERTISHLKILKLDDGSIVDTCINLDVLEPDTYLWSPDSQQLIALTGDSTFVFDVIDGKIYQFERIGFALVAWLSSEP